MKNIVRILTGILAIVLIATAAMTDAAAAFTDSYSLNHATTTVAISHSFTGSFVASQNIIVWTERTPWLTKGDYTVQSSAVTYYAGCDNLAVIGRFIPTDAASTSYRIIWHDETGVIGWTVKDSRTKIEISVDDVPLESGTRDGATSYSVIAYADGKAKTANYWKKAQKSFSAATSFRAVAYVDMTVYMHGSEDMIIRAAEEIIFGGR